MATIIDICNQALSHVRAASIQSIDDTSVEGLECKRHFEIVRDAVLAKFMWNFATKTETLADTGDEYSGWSYAYAYPTDCVKARRIYNSAGSPRLPFEIRSNADKDARIILTDVEDAILVYTAEITNVNMYSPEFVEMLAYALAVELAVPVCNNEELKEKRIFDYQRLQGQAEAINAREDYEVPNSDSSILDSR